MCSLSHWEVSLGLSETPQSFNPIPYICSLRNSLFLYSSFTFIYVWKLTHSFLGVFFIPAVSSQMGTIKTNTKYLHSSLSSLFLELLCGAKKCWSVATLLPKLWLWIPLVDIFTTSDILLNDCWPTDKQMLFNSGFSESNTTSRAKFSVSQSRQSMVES